MKLPNFVKSWLPFFLTATLLSGLIYVTVQQNYRMGANDPQIQMVQDKIAELKDSSIVSTTSKSKVNLETSLSTFTMTFAENKDIVDSNATLGSTTPKPPDGVFDFVKTKGEERFTWQPANGVRIAAVMDYYSTTSGSGYVLAGRSLKEVEIREDNLQRLIIFGWLFISLSTLYLIWYLNQESKKSWFRKILP